MDESAVPKADTESLDDEYLTTKELAAFLKVEEQTIHMWRNRGRAPRAHRLNGHLLRFKRGDVIEWLSEQAEDAQEDHVMPTESSPGLRRVHTSAQAAEAGV